MVQEALEREPALTGVQVTDETTPGSVSELRLGVSGKHNGVTFLMDVTL
jgi:hypothetical protein